jgi:hypothetical protein
VSGREAVIFFKRVEHFFILPSSRCVYLEHCLERWPSLDQTAKDRIRQKQAQYEPKIIFNERGCIIPGIDDNQKAFFSLWDMRPINGLPRPQPTGSKVTTPTPTTTAHSPRSQSTGSKVTTPTPIPTATAHTQTAQKGASKEPVDMSKVEIPREYIEGARKKLQEMTLSKHILGTVLGNPPSETHTKSPSANSGGELTGTETIQVARAKAEEAFKQRRLRRAEEIGDQDESGKVKEPRVIEKSFEGMKEAIQQAATDKAAGRAAMFRNIRGQTTPSKLEEGSQKSTPAHRQEEKIIIKMPVPDAYDLNGFRLVEEKEVTRVIAKPRKKSTPTIFKDLIKSKMDRIVSQFSKGESDGSGKNDESEGQAQTAPGVNVSGSDEYAVKGGNNEMVPEGVVDESNGDVDEPFDYQDQVIRRFPDMWAYILQTQAEAIPPAEHRSKYWTEKKALAAQEELLEYWSQFDKAT